MTGILKNKKVSPVFTRESKTSAENSALLDSQSGFTLIEMLIAITMFTICIGAAYGLMEVARQSRFTVNQQVQTMQGVRNAMNRFGRDVLNAGYGDFRQSGNGALLKDGAVSNLLGIPSTADGSLDNLTTIVPGNDLTLNSLSGNNTDQITFLYQDILFNSNASMNVAANGIEDDGLFVTTDGNYINCRVNDLYLISGTTASAIGMATAIKGGPTGTACIPVFTNNDLFGFNRVANNGPINTLQGNPANLIRVTLVTYRVLANGTFVRTLYGNNPTGTTRADQIQDSPLVHNVEDMQIEYVMVDGTISANPAPSSMQDVRQVRINLLVQSSQKDVRTNEPLKVTLTSIFNTRNMGYDRS
jgi:type II secretion system protein J